ncbi:hypothetical protein [Vibrio vulnificus]|uniref:hypothetical protein n=1 Tax=Vibrio vulnificus TaxID=672 RepID=UPI0013923127|nr:hypothetical protein [Vibrio vulnificus]
MKIILTSQQKQQLEEMHDSTRDVVCFDEKRPDKSDLLECGGSETAGFTHQSIDFK